MSNISLVGWLCVLCAVASAAVLVHYLVRRPPLTLATKGRLAVGFALFPMLAAVSSTSESLRVSTERDFCGSCHVMDMHVSDAESENSTSLAARHSRNPFFGDRNCYVCHADYGMLGYPMTKITGMQHVWAYYANGYLGQSTEQAVERIHLYKPYDNTNCRQCHSGKLPKWRKVPEHVSLEAQLDSNRVSCASEGCHGYAHPFSKHTKGDALSRAMDQGAEAQLP